MRVFLCKGSFYSPVSGPDEQLICLAEQLRKICYSPSILLAVPYAKDDLYFQSLSKAGVSIICLGRHPLYLFLLALRKIVSFIFPEKVWKRTFNWERLLYLTMVYYFRRQRPDIVHILVEAGTFVRAAYKAGVPVVYQESAIPGYPLEAGTEILYEKLRESLSYCSEVLALSPTLAQLCRDFFPLVKAVSVVPLLVPDPVKDLPLVEKEENKVTFGFAARLEKLKGPHILLDAFALLQQEKLSARLIMAGSGKDEKELREQAESLSLACEFSGAYFGPAEKSAFMRSLDIFVQPSFAEGTPNSIAEAMAHGLPIIATTVGGVSDVVTSDTGILVPPGDAHAIASAMRHLVENPDLRVRMGQAARQRYEQLFAPPAVMPIIQSTYARVIAKNADKNNAPLAIELSHPWARIRV